MPLHTHSCNTERPRRFPPQCSSGASTAPTGRAPTPQATGAFCTGLWALKCRSTFRCAFLSVSPRFLHCLGAAARKAGLFPHPPRLTLRLYIARPRRTITPPFSTGELSSTGARPIRPGCAASPYPPRTRSPPPAAAPRALLACPRPGRQPRPGRRFLSNRRTRLIRFSASARTAPSTTRRISRRASTRRCSTRTARPRTTGTSRRATTTTRSSGRPSTWRGRLTGRRTETSRTAPRRTGANGGGGSSGCATRKELCVAPADWRGGDFPL